ERQRETLLWEAEEARAAGVAGNIVYAYTDEWFNAGAEVEDWAFGLVRKDRTEKPAAVALGRWLQQTPPPLIGEPSDKRPLVSVVVCSRNGHGFLPACLKSLRDQDFPELEILLIDDGSEPPLESLGADSEDVRVIRQEHRGLSVARNRGFAEARGEIIAYTDDDCVADREWVTRLVLALSNHRWDAVGGPNIPPPTTDPIKRSLGLAPGNPVQVLLSDEEAEHLPGCNFAVTRAAFSALGGFAERYWTAGDDVDFCWRLRDAGFQIGYAPTAFVWHHPRSKIDAYFRQQKGYGRAEALLMDDHPKRFARSGGALWTGRVYQNSPSWELGGTPIIYHGRFGNALFQSVEGQRWEGLTRWKDLVLSWPWIAVALSLLVFGLLLPGLAFIGLIALAGTLAFGLDQARNVAVRREDRKPLPFAVLTGLQCAQPALRQAARIFHQSPRPEQRPIFSSTLSFWNPNGVSRETWLDGLQTRLPDEPGSRPTQAPGRGWDFWDFPLPDSPFCQFRVSTTSEAHDGPARLNRLRTDAWVFPAYRWLAWWTLGFALVLLLAGHGILSLLAGLLILVAWVLIRTHAQRVLAPTLAAARTEAAAFEFTELDEHEPTPANV
ncbi:MAG: glycosyltransferase, partial [Verrucomicrobiota bacterium]